MLDVFGTKMYHGMKPLGASSEMKTRKHLSAKTFFRLGTAIFGVPPLAFPSPSHLLHWNLQIFYRMLSPIIIREWPYGREHVR